SCVPVCIPQKLAASPFCPRLHPTHVQKLTASPFASHNCQALRFRSLRLGHPPEHLGVERSVNERPEADGAVEWLKIDEEPLGPVDVGLHLLEFPALLIDLV